MSVKAVTPSDAARNPKHPEHARWVKEQTLKREIEHANMLGLSSRAAEDANSANLIRLDARRRLAKPQAPKKPQQPQVTHEELRASGVTKKAPKVRPQPKVPPCKYCGACIKCRRELRVRAIMALARQGDTRALALTNELVALVFAQQKRKIYRDHIGRELPFSDLQGRDRIRANNAGIEAVCDRSVSFLGEWR